ncbi:MAG TPA: RsiV family protein [Pyrinomonadaceae bacterium]|nr:RsiV family protein [Pyrinomonadaceae bacterium]
MPRLFAFLLACAFSGALLSSACAGKREAGAQEQQSPAGQSKTGEPARADAQATTAAAKTNSAAKTFRGEIDGRYKVQMRLARTASTLAGSYFYENVKTEIRLDGSIDERGNFTLEERDASGKPTGLFKGRWSMDEQGRLVELKGDWSKPGGRALSFYLSEMPVAFAKRALRVLTNDIREENKKRRFSIEVEYPQLEGSTEASVARFNAESKAFAEREVARFKQNLEESDDGGRPPEMGDDLGIGYTLGAANDRVVSVQFSIGTYYAGAAHPNHNTAVINFDLDSGRTLALADLFNSSSDYLRVLSDYCIADLKRQAARQGADSMLTDEGIEQGAAAETESFHSWLLTRDGLEITFDPYEVAPYAAGSQSVLIPYDVLKQILKPDGVVASLMR